MWSHFWERRSFDFKEWPTKINLFYVTANKKQYSNVICVIKPGNVF